MPTSTPAPRSLPNSVATSAEERTRPFLGVLEGFYGEPYTDAARLELVRWLGSQGGTDFVYAPKGDPYQRDRWREPYPVDRIEYFRSLVATGREVGVEIGLVISPGLDWTGSTADTDALIAKLCGLAEAGAGSLGVAFDDVPPGGADLGSSHGQAVAAAVAGVAAAGYAGIRWASCPTDYAAVEPTSYLRAFAAALPAGVVLMWTGPSIVSATVTAADVARLAELGAPLVLADNVPVNDGAMSGVLHLGPYPLRDPALPALTGGLLLNLMPGLPLASRITAAAAMRWWREPTGDREAQWRAVLDETPGIAPLARSCRSWLTDPGPEVGLLKLADRALAGDGELEAWLAAGPRAGLPADWQTELEPWLKAWEWEAFATVFALYSARGAAADPGRCIEAAFGVTEVRRRLRLMGEQVFGIRFAGYPLTRQDGDRLRPDAAGLVRGENLTDYVCRRALEIAYGHPVRPADLP